MPEKSGRSRGEPGARGLLCLQGLRSQAPWGKGLGVAPVDEEEVAGGEAKGFPGSGTTSSAHRGGGRRQAGKQQRRGESCRGVWPRLCEEGSVGFKQTGCVKMCIYRSSMYLIYRERLLHCASGTAM